MENISCLFEKLFYLCRIYIQYMNTNTMTLEGLIADYQSFLEDNLTGKEVTEIAYKIQKSPKTIYNYLDTDGECKAKDFLTMKAIVEIGVEILSLRGISK